MALQLIGAGLPRTGTSSLREALRHLLGAPVHHMSEVFAHPEQASTWTSALHGDPPDWHDFLAGYAAGVDAPFSLCWRELAAACPDVPVLLSLRADAQVWLRSMEATVIPRTREILAGDRHDPVHPLFAVLFRDLGDIDDGDQLVAGYRRWADDVRAEIAPERLVVWRPGDGWEPLCRALDVPIPDSPFPHENSTTDYRARQQARAEQDVRRRASGDHAG